MAFPGPHHRRRRVVRRRGLLGVAAHAEIAVRLVLGAHPRDVTRMVLAEALVLGVSGTALGLGRRTPPPTPSVPSSMESPSPDSGSFLLSAGLLLLTTLVASYVPGPQGGAGRAPGRPANGMRHA